MNASDSWPAVERRVVAILTLWASAVSLAGWRGIVADLPVPVTGILVTLGTVAPVAFYYRSGGFHAYIRHLGVRSLTVLHVWRIVAALIFFEYGARGLLPERFVTNAAWGDLVVGLLVPVVFMLPESRSKWIAFHSFGMLDFLVAVGTGVTFSLRGVPGMETITSFPLVLIPLFGVCVSGATHLIALDLLLRGGAVGGAMTGGLAATGNPQAPDALP